MKTTILKTFGVVSSLAIMKKFTCLMVTGLVLAGMSLSVHAATSGPFTTSTPIPLQLTDWNGTLVFPQFNPALGTLNSVTLDFSSSMQTTLTVSNGGASVSTGTAQTEETVSVEDAGNNFISDAPQLDYYTSKFAYNNLAVNATVTSGLLTKSGDSGALVYTGTPILTEFTGLGNISLDASTVTYTVLETANGNNYASQVTDAGATGTVTYNYTAVPEPSTIGLVITGLLGALVIRRRKV